MIESKISNIFTPFINHFFRRGKKIVSTLISVMGVVGIVLGFLLAVGIGYQRWTTMGRLTYDSYISDDHITYDILRNIRISNLK